MSLGISPRSTIPLPTHISSSQLYPPDPVPSPPPMQAGQAVPCSTQRSGVYTSYPYGSPGRGLVPVPSVPLAGCGIIPFSPPPLQDGQAVQCSQVPSQVP